MKSLKGKENEVKKLVQIKKIRNQMGKVFTNRLKMVENIRLKPKSSYCFIFLDFARVQRGVMVAKNTFRFP